MRALALPALALLALALPALALPALALPALALLALALPALALPALALMIPYNLLRNVGSWFRPTPLYSCRRGEDGDVGCGVVVQADPV